MLNAVRMDLYRMFQTRALYITWIVMAVLIVFTTYLATIDVKDAEAQESNYQLYLEEADGENMNAGMQVTLPTEPGEQVTLYDLMYANTQGKFVAIFMVVFAVLFSAADLGSGYIKNIGGQVKGRARLVVSKAVALCVQILLTFGIFTLVQAVSARSFFGYLKIGPEREFLSYLATEYLLHVALAWICMAIALLLRSNVFSMMIGICLCMNVTVVLYSLIDTLVFKMGVEDFRLIEYTVTGQISLLPLKQSADSSIRGILTALLFGAAALAAGSLIFTKRDIE